MTEKAGPARVLAVRTEVRGWREAFPPAQWLAGYRLQWFPHDALAGVTLAACGIPVSLAGLPPQYAIYCYRVGGLFYALFGSQNLGGRCRRRVPAHDGNGRLSRDLISHLRANHSC